jgi:hypothetical protein
MASNDQRITSMNDKPRANANSGRFTKGSARASEAGKKGAKAQPLEAKIRGGQNSHRTG